MSLQFLSITHLRNILRAEVELSPGFNLFYGDNGSGKTSFLEAIHFLAMGRSFRTHLPGRVVQRDASCFQLFAKVGREQEVWPLGFEYCRDGKRTVRLAQRDVDSVVELAKLIPLQLFVPESHRLLTDAPKLRRQFLDWGVFHVEHQFVSHWQRLQRALKQRNAALRHATRPEEAQFWDGELISAGLIMHQMRAQYISEFLPIFEEILQSFLPDLPITITYKPGWDEEATLAEVLQQSFARDVEAGYTHYGPHRADLKMTYERTPVCDVLSQGQQKLLVIALKLAQGKLLHLQTGRRCLYLLDDLTAELDAHKRGLVAAILQGLDAQVFVTSADQESLLPLTQKMQEVRLFAVDSGRFQVIQ